MKIISWNVNGIRACANKGFLSYLDQENPDILCLQETKAQPENLEEALINPAGYFSIWHSAQKRGYSGVSVFTRPKPHLVLEGFGQPRYDVEGRVIVAEYPQFVLLNVYFPNGQRDETRLQYKMDFYSDFFAYCAELRKEGKNLVICGDYNTAHCEIDLANPQQNANYSGFLPAERAWLDRLLADGYIDTFRHFQPAATGQYTWWTYRFGARHRNIGWRIDYVLITPGLLPYLTSAFIQPAVSGSDHCPVGITLDFT